MSQGINLPKEYYGSGWIAENAFPDVLSTNDWTVEINQDPLTGNKKTVRPLKQQTFLGCSIADFNVNGGFGDTSSVLNIKLVQDLSNKSDEYQLGFGDDPYHNGSYDFFNAPPVGSPVFFKFGPGYCTIPQSWRKTYDDIYGYDTTSQQSNPIIKSTDRLLTLNENQLVNVEESNFPEGNKYIIYDYTNIDSETSLARGIDHFVFGGILQSYSKDLASEKVYNVSVSDPRDILSNTTLILNNYSSSTLNIPNLFNIFGFLEYNPSQSLKNLIETFYDNKYLFKKIVNSDGTVSYLGGYDRNRNINYPLFTDSYVTNSWLDYLALSFTDPSKLIPPTVGQLPNVFPYTGTSLSRRTDRGIPLYRVIQALNSMMGFYGQLPLEYETQQFGKFINFRGFNYIVDFGTLPIDKIPVSYCLDFDQMNLLELCQEICDITSHDFYVSLLPVIDHPAVSYIHSYNESQIFSGNNQNIITGIIRIDAIDRSVKPNYGAISLFVESLKNAGSEIKNSSTGFELSNVPTDKFIVGAQEVDMYFFTNNGDRDNLEVRKSKAGQLNRLNQQSVEQWYISNSLKQQILPFYGFLGDGAVTIPRGYGAYQQILLDASNLNANGVGNYYVATEMELRAALVSFDSWKEFLIQYNDIYLESVDDNDSLESAFVSVANLPVELQKMTLPVSYSKEYGVTVPRCVFRSDKNYLVNNLPASPCSPPYGFPLYYKRASSIGVPEVGIGAFSVSINSLLTNIAAFKNNDDKNYRKLVNSAWQNLLQESEAFGLSSEEKSIIDFIKRTLKENPSRNPADVIIGLLEEQVNKNSYVYQDIAKTTDEQLENVNKIYEFVKKAANNLGTKFLVKIPKETNPFYDNSISFRTNFTQINGQAQHIGGPLSEYIYEIENGPFGFAPRSLNMFNTVDNGDILQARAILNNPNGNKFTRLLSYGIEDGLTDLVSSDFTYGAIKSQYDEISDSYIFNYVPEPQGGFFRYDLYKNVMSPSSFANISYLNYPSVIKGMLFPIDAKNLMNGDNRISAYVRFDNSQFLDFSEISSDLFTQVAVSTFGNAILPDLVLDLNNVSEDKFTTFSPDSKTNKDLDKEPMSCAFVKVELDGKFYMPPKFSSDDYPVFGRLVENRHKIRRSRRIFDSNTGEERVTIPIYEPHFVPINEQYPLYAIQEDFNRDSYCIDGSLAVGSIQNIAGEYVDQRGIKFLGEIIKTSTEDQDDNHIYALITLPGPIRSRIDYRFVDSMFQVNQPGIIKHILTQDVVKGMPGFDSPGFIHRPNIKTQDIDGLTEARIIKNKKDLNIPDNFVSMAEISYKKAIEALGFNSNFLNIAMPSPVYPDIVALPLMSRERCYGPWISSMSKKEAAMYSNIPGKIDFIKDELLSPWSYNGYDLMNEAGLLQAEFSNSLMLFLENGSISFVGLPSGNCLLKPLVNGGPLVTSIDFSINSSDITTTYNMSTYIPRFGNIQKQKADLISKISRERQKLTDEKNNLIRKGITKGIVKQNYLYQDGVARSLQNFSGFSQDLKSYAEIMQKSFEVVSSPTVNNSSFIDLVSNDEYLSEICTNSNSIRPVGIGSSLNTDARSQINSVIATTKGIPFEGVSKDRNPFIPNLMPQKETPIEDVDDLFIG
jgi:hypothetical protein